jgi:hypothetical protein
LPDGFSIVQIASVALFDSIGSRETTMIKAKNRLVLADKKSAI